MSNAGNAAVLDNWKGAYVLFARNWNSSQVVVALDNPNDPHRLTAGDFFAIRANG